MATVIVAALIVGIGAMIAIPVIKSAATHSTWGGKTACCGAARRILCSYAVRDTQC